MSIEDELAFFDESFQLLSGFIESLAQLDPGDIEAKHKFLAEAVLFRMYRNYERFMRASFLHFCVEKRTMSGAAVYSKLTCEDWDVAESILKSGNKFLDWGNATNLRVLAGIVYTNGFPISDLIMPIQTDLVDLQRFRNFIAHDSREAGEGFKKSRTHYVRVGDELPETVGELALYRKNPRNDIVIKLIYQKISQLSVIFRSL